MSLLGTALILAAALAADCQAPSAQYAVTYESERLFHIEATFNEGHNGFFLYFHPSSDRPRGQSDSLIGVEAFDSDGSPVAIAYDAEGVWRADSPVVRLSYRLAADHDQTKWTYGADEVANPLGGGFYFAGHAIFLTPESPAEDCGVEASFDLPQGWTVVAPWAGEGIRRTTPSYADFYNNGFAMAPITPSVQRVGAFKVTSAFDTRLEASVKPKIDTLLSDLLPAYVAYFGGQPSADYATFHFPYATSDGSAFRHSFALQYATPLNENAAFFWERTLAHETMHLWIGAEGIRREGDEIEWFTEGFTDYLALKHLYALGYIDDENMRRELGSMVTRYQLGRMLSGPTSLREAGENKSQHWFLIYGGGGLIAMLLDARMDAEAPGAFDAAMADLFANRAEPYDFDRLMGALDARSEGAASAVFASVDSGMSRDAIDADLSAHGMRVGGGMDMTQVRFEAACANGASGCAPAFLTRLAESQTD